MPKNQVIFKNHENEMIILQQQQKKLFDENLERNKTRKKKS